MSEPSLPWMPAFGSIRQDDTWTNFTIVHDFLSYQVATVSSETSHFLLFLSILRLCLVTLKYSAQCFRESGGHRPRLRSVAVTTELSAPEQLQHPACSTALQLPNSQWAFFMSSPNTHHYMDGGCILFIFLWSNFMFFCLRIAKSWG